MARKHSFLIRITTISLLISLLGACDPGKIRFGEVRMMYGSNEDGRISYVLSSFSGVENGSIQADAGQTIDMKIDVQLSKGTLTVEWLDPGGEVVWLKEYNGSVNELVEIPIEISGEYSLLIQGKEAGGSFDITWETE